MLLGRRLLVLVLLLQQRWWQWGQWQQPQRQLLLAWLLPPRLVL
jgi:hypothetical protein